MRALRILYVEDNLDIRDALAEILGEGGHAVVACANGEEALVAYGAEPFDLILTDVSLPGLSGIEMARRALATHPHQWVVFCSGYELGPGLAAIGRNVRSLTKSFEMEALFALLDAIAVELDAAPPAEPGSA